MLGLMNMPREIRYQILELCLRVEGTINPYPAHHEAKDQFAKCNRRPDVALLKVNTVLNFEATRIIYSMNTWQLSSPRPLEHPSLQKDLVWNLHPGRVFRLRILMNINDLPPNIILEAARKADERSLNGYQRAIFVHNLSLKGTLETWHWKMEMIQYIKPLTLEIDMENMYCPIGCCRDDFIRCLGRMMRTIVCVNDQLRILRLSRGQTTHLSVVGLAKGEEQNLIREFWKHDSEGEVVEESIDAASQVTIHW